MKALHPIRVKLPMQVIDYQGYACPVIAVSSVPATMNRVGVTEQVVVTFVRPTLSSSEGSFEVGKVTTEIIDRKRADALPTKEFVITGDGWEKSSMPRDMSGSGGYDHAPKV